jgi:hypothetical protein
VCVVPQCTMVTGEVFSCVFWYEVHSVMTCIICLLIFQYDVMLSGMPGGVVPIPAIENHLRPAAVQKSCVVKLVRNEVYASACNSLSSCESFCCVLFHMFI